MKQITAYRCEHCNKDFKTPTRHICRKKPEYKNCYTCEYWLHQFVVDTTWNGDEYRQSCTSEKACIVNSVYVEDAFYLMRSNGWGLNFVDWKLKKAPSWDDVENIRKDNRSLREIAKDYNVDHTTIADIKNNKTWKVEEIKK